MKDLKKLLQKFSVGFILFGIVLWLVETSYFILAHGWSWSAHNPWEELWDKISTLSINIGFILGFAYLVLSIHKIVIIKD